MESRVTVYAICWNEIFMLPHFFNHYDWAEKIVIYDNGSDDGSQEFVMDHPKGELRHFNTLDEQNNQIMRRVKNGCWKGDTSDWVVVCDVDEFLVGHEKLDQHLGQVCVFDCRLFEMVSEVIPDDLKDIKTRVLYNWWNAKCLCFSPKISEINYTLGAHSCKPIPNNRIKGVLEINHYRYLSEDYLVEKWQRYGARMGEQDRRREIAQHYLWEDQKIRDQFKMVLSKAKRKGETFVYVKPDTVHHI